MWESYTLTRRGILRTSIGAFGCALVGGAGRADSAEPRRAAPAPGPASLPLDVWRRRLTPEQFHVLFEDGTERPFSSPLDGEKREGTFVCAACHRPLFESSAKFDSGTGWPSFSRPIDGSVSTRRDFKLLLPRTEYHCARCGGHQGHVFGDGPPPTGQRWCNNGVALRFVPAGEPLPELVS